MTLKVEFIFCLCLHVKNSQTDPIIIKEHVMNSDSEPLLSDQEKNTRRLQKSTDAIDRCLRIVVETQDIGADTLVRLDDQKHTIIRIQDKLDNSINPNINKSNSVLTSMFRRLRNNKYVTYATIFVCIAIIIMLIVLIFTKRS